MRHALIALVLLFKVQASFAAETAEKCADRLVGPGSIASAWSESVEALQTIQQRVYGRGQVIEALTAAILAKEFVWINGEPGGAKTYLSRLMFQAVLNSIPQKEKKMFVLQFHKLIAEGKITGFQKFSSMMKDGKYEIETESALVGDRFLFLIADEAEKSNPAVLNALLSVLNERKAFLGARVVEAALASGVFTSNKTTGEFIQGFLNDRPSGEALLDRMAIKIHIPNQQLNAKETVAMYDLVKNPNNARISLPLGQIESLITKVKVPDDLMAEIVAITREFDRYVTRKSDESRAAVRYGEAESEYFPANQFSNRSVRRLVQIFKAALEQYVWLHGEEIWIRDGVRVNPMNKHRKLGGHIFSRCVELCCVSPSAVLIRKDIFHALGGFRQDFPVCEDYELWLRLASRYPVGFVEQPVLLKYGGHADQLSRRFKAMDYFRCKALVPFLLSEEIPKNELSLVAAAVIEKCDILVNGYIKHGNLENMLDVREWRAMALRALEELNDQDFKDFNDSHSTHSTTDFRPRSEDTVIL